MLTGLSRSINDPRVSAILFCLQVLVKFSSSGSFPAKADRNNPNRADQHNSIRAARAGRPVRLWGFVAVVQQVGRKRMSKRVWASRFRDLRFEPGLFNGLLENRFVEVVPPLFSCDRIGVMAGGWKHPLPSPVPTCVGILSVQSVGQADLAECYRLTAWRRRGRGSRRISESDFYDSTIIK